jgi:hypothetical protein
MEKVIKFVLFTSLLVVLCVRTRLRVANWDSGLLVRPRQNAADARCDGMHCVPDWARLPTRKESWRGNNYVRDNGILPYIACRNGADWPRTTARFNHTSRFNNTNFEDTYEMLLLGASMYGETEEIGRPVRIDTVEMMMHVRCTTCGPKRTVGGTPFEWSDARIGLIEFDCTFSAPSHSPIVTRGLASNLSLTMPFNATDVDVLEQLGLHQGNFGGVAKRDRTMGAAVVCPAPTSDEWYAADAWPDQFTVALTPRVPVVLGPSTKDKHHKWMAMEVCYDHVDFASYIVACTQPWHGWQRGVRNKKFEGPLGTCHNYVDEYINHHRNVGYGHIYVYAEDNYTNPMQRYIDEGYVTLTEGVSQMAEIIANNRCSLATFYV